MTVRMSYSIALALLATVILTGCATRPSSEQRTISKLQSDKNRLKRKTFNLNRHVESLRKRRKELENRINTLEKRLQTAQKKQNQAQQRARTLSRKLNERVSTLNQKLQSLNQRSTKIQELIEDINKLLNSTRKNQRNFQETLSALTRRIQNLRKKIGDLSSGNLTNLRKLKRQNRQLEAKLSNIERADADQDGQNVVVTVKSHILFDLGEYSLKTSSRKTLRSIAKILAQYPDRPIAVEGHTDTVPVTSNAKFSTNWHLSAYRAISVIQFLTDRRNLSKRRFRAVGYGPTQPIKPNTSPENRRLNRRVEIVLYPPTLERKTIQPSTNS